MVSNLPFLFFQLLVHVYIGDKAVVVDGVEGNVDFLEEGVGAGEGGEVHGIGN